MSLDLDAYFARIGFEGSVAPDLEFLRAVHRLHPAAIPFENLSTLIGDSVPLDLESLARKLLHDRRGGYCFEQNRLFASVLETVGFVVRPLAARVIWNQDTGWINPRTHMLLLVDAKGSRYLCDVGFGGATLTAPLEFALERVQATPHEDFRLIGAGAEYELQVRFGDAGARRPEWRGMYRFDLQPQMPIDYEMANHYVATHPGSHFRSQLMAGRPFESGRYALANAELTTYGNAAPKQTLRLRSVAEIKAALADVFGIELPESARLDSALGRVVDPLP